MADELEPVSGDEIEPTAVYGPDDWRPYAGHVDLRRVLDDILYGIGRENRRRAYSYDPLAEAQYSDPQNVREPARTPDEYAYTGHYLTPALREAQRRLRERMEFSMQFRDPSAIIKVTGTGA